jgi:hypothetical protein
MRSPRRSRLSLVCPTSADIFPRVSPLWKKVMKSCVAARPGTTLAESKFRDMTEAQVLLALKSKDIAVAAEVARLVAAYFTHYRFALECGVHEASVAMLADIGYPIQKVAVGMLVSFMRRELFAAGSGHIH